MQSRSKADAVTMWLPRYIGILAFALEGPLRIVCFVEPRAVKMSSHLLVIIMQLLSF